MSTQERAYAKLNLTLDVLGRREDGYHDLCMLMQSVSLYDEVTLIPTQRTGVRVSSNLGFLPTGGNNLAAVAALRFWEARESAGTGLSIQIAKRIPVSAGLAGGSSDAAAVLRALNRMEGEVFTMEQLMQIGEKVGSDVPYCVVGGTALAQGRGERITTLSPIPACWVVLCKPPFPISTPELFARIDRVSLRYRPDTAGMLRALEARDLAGVARRLYNVFEDALLPQHYRAIQEVKRTMLECNCLGTVMSGSGPTVFALFETQAGAQEAKHRLSLQYRDTFFAQPV